MYIVVICTFFMNEIFLEDEVTCLQSTAVPQGFDWTINCLCSCRNCGRVLPLPKTNSLVYTNKSKCGIIRSIKAKNLSIFTEDFTIIGLHDQFLIHTSSCHTPQRR